MQDFERSQLAELLREQNRLLRDIKEQGEPINTIEKLKARLSPSEFDEAVAAKVSSASLEEIADASAQAAGFSDSVAWLEHLQKTRNRRELEKINTKSIFEMQASLPGGKIAKE